VPPSFRYRCNACLLFVFIGMNVEETSRWRTDSVQRSI